MNPLDSCALFVPLEIAQRPISGECLVDHYWPCHPENGIAFSAVLSGPWKSTIPHAFGKEDLESAQLLTERVFPGMQVAKVPVVFLEHARQLMLSVQQHYQKAQEKERKKTKKPKKSKKMPEGINGAA